MNGSSAIVRTVPFFVAAPSTPAERRSEIRSSPASRAMRSQRTASNSPLRAPVVRRNLEQRHDVGVRLSEPGTVSARSGSLVACQRTVGVAFVAQLQAIMRQLTAGVNAARMIS